MELKTLLSALGIDREWEPFGEIYPASQKLFEEEKLWYLEEDFLRSCQRKYGALGRYEEIIVSTAEIIKADPYLSRYLGILRYIVHCRKDAVELLGTVPLPKPQNEEARLKTELLSFYVFPPEAERIYDFMRSKNMPEETVNVAVRGPAGCIGGFEHRHKRVGYERLYLVWSMHYVECKLLKFGSLSFELKGFSGNVAYFRNKKGETVLLCAGDTYHKSGNLLGNPDFEDEAGSYTASLCETDEYFEGVKIENCLASGKKVRLYKNEWEKILSKGDNIINVHIPAKTDLSPENVKKTCEYAAKMIAGAFPDYNSKAFVCFSWLLDPKLADMLYEGSKIVSFQKRFIRFPTRSSGKDVFIFLFATDEQDYTKLPENTTLERAVKKYYLDGKHINKFGGAFFDL